MCGCMAEIHTHTMCTGGVYGELRTEKATLSVGVLDWEADSV